MTPEVKQRMLDSLLAAKELLSFNAKSLKGATTAEQRLMRSREAVKDMLNVASTLNKLIVLIDIDA